MKVVDLRPGHVKLALSLWSGALPVGKPANRLPVWISPARLYGKLLERVMARRVSQRPAPPESRPFLLSIGNLALGGTGKTPVVGALAEELASRGLQGAILTRGFGSALAGPIVVEASNPLAGDEARWHAGRMEGTGWTIIQSRNRPRGLKFLGKNRPRLDVVLIEDGHQTAGLARHLDLVILDQWDSKDSGKQDSLLPLTGPVFPFGPWRESAAGANRADILLVESEQDVPDTSVDGCPVVVFRRRMKLRDSQSQSDVLSTPFSWVGLSGIAHPIAFERGVMRAVGSCPAVVIRCSDHVRYTPDLVRSVLLEMKKSGAKSLVTTAKDWVKLEALWPEDVPLVVADLDIWWGDRNALPDIIEERVGLLPTINRN
ncbi:MAG: tetraacyldisaccharide 4'-kinase [Gemmatimonadales bacterium]|nr:tetraacyldisaccharide 4'-kinase [Gemmatimonadales bacterium]